MWSTINNYLSQNPLVWDSVLLLFGSFIIPYLLTSKKEGMILHNGTSYQQVLILIRETIVIQQPRKPGPIKPSSSSSNDELGFIIFIFLIVTGLFIKFHDELMRSLIYFTAFALISTVSIAVKLIINKQYDRLNQWYTALMLFLVTTNSFTIYFMSKQDLTTGELTLMVKVFYYAIGLIGQVLPNLYMLFLIIHIMSVNIYLSRQWSLFGHILQVTSRFVLNPIRTTIIIALICTISLLLSSGVAFNFASKQIEKNTLISIDQL